MKNEQNQTILAGKVPAGYKQTEVGIIPEDWEVVTMGNIGWIYGGLSGKKKEDFSKGNAKYIPFTNVMSNIVIDLNKLDKVIVNESQNRVLKNDLLFNGSSETPEELCLCSIIDVDVENLYLNSFCFGFRNKNQDVVEKFLAYFYRSNIGRNLIQAIAQGSTRYNISKKQFLNLQIPLPPKAEQTAIAEALSDVDSLLVSLEKLIEKKRAIKTGTMQQLLTGKKRLPAFAQREDGTPKGYKTTELGEIPEDWEVVKLSDVTTCLDHLRFPLNESQRAKMKGDIPYCGANGIVDWINDFMIDDEIILIAEDGGYFDEYATRPIAYRVKGKCWVNNHAHILKSIQGTSQDYIFYCLVHKDIQKYLASGTRAKLNKQEMEKIEIIIPELLQEQTAIAEILSDMDAEIEALEAKRAKTEEIKQGMMQELLTGRTRLI